MADHKLGRLLQILHTAPTEVACGYLPFASELLATLTNALNITILSTHLLVAPSLWNPSSTLVTARRVLTTFYSAAVQFDRRKKLEQGAFSRPSTAAPLAPQTLSQAEWFGAVLSGVNTSSPPWHHLLALAGLFLSADQSTLSPVTQEQLSTRLLLAIQKTGAHLSQSPPVAAHSFVFVLANTFEKFSESVLSGFDYDALLPLVIEVAYNSSEGMGRCGFIQVIGSNVRFADGQYGWPTDSNSSEYIKGVLQRPLMKSMSPAVWLIMHSIRRCKRPASITAVLDRLHVFSYGVHELWRKCQISGVDTSEENDAFDSTSLVTILPVLWRLLNIASFCVTATLRAVLRRMISDPALGKPPVAPGLAAKVLYILRDLSFITLRTRPTEQYVFVTSLAIDILVKSPPLAENFVTNIQGRHTGSIPRHPMDRCLDMFFFHTAIHFVGVVQPLLNENVLLRRAHPYLTATSPKLRDIFETSHTFYLHVLSAPVQPRTAQHVRMYTEILFSVFPDHLSGDRFRQAYKRLLQITAPPSPLSNTDPYLAHTITDMLSHQCNDACDTEIRGPGPHPEPPLTPRAILTLAYFDILPLLPPDELRLHLPHASHLAHRHSHHVTERTLQKHFWVVMSRGDMDAKRSEVCFEWWTKRGGHRMHKYAEEKMARLLAEHPPKKQQKQQQQK